MKHIGVTHKLWLGVGSIVLGSVVIVGVAGYNSAQHQKKHGEQDRLLSQRLEQATQWHALTQVNAVRTLAQVFSRDAQDAELFSTQIAGTDQHISTLQQALEGTARDAADRSQMQNVVALRQAMQAQRDLMLQKKATDQEDESRALARAGYRQAVDAYLAGLLAFVQHQSQGLEAMRAEMGAARQGVVRSSAVNMVVLLLGVSIGAYLLINSIRRSLVQANGVAGQIAAGDLRSQWEVQRHDEFGKLLLSLQAMSQSLAAMIQDVSVSGDAIALASAEIASGNQDLSQRTEITSSHLQQAASAMLQLTSTLQQTAASAQQAAGLADQASGVAQRGGAVVGQVVTTMNDIHTSSQKIADIIGVIDGIAFQTNILALNAAVEAARAGEQGRGFAVVASEVRSLAGRSADAAKEIKQLIQASVERVADGARLVNEAGGTMHEIVQSVQRVTQVMGEINASAAEQRDGVAQVSEAVGALDQMTQQNAALVEESAAAAYSLREQSAHLREMVQRFQVPDALQHGAMGDAIGSGMGSPVAAAVPAPRVGAATAETHAAGARPSPALAPVGHAASGFVVDPVPHAPNASNMPHVTRRLELA